VSALTEELRRLRTYEERHRRLFARLALVVIATAILDILGALAIFLLARHAKNTDVATAVRRCSSPPPSS
jgi:hypothetical protein